MKILGLFFFIYAFNSFSQSTDHDLASEKRMLEEGYQTETLARNKEKETISNYEKELAQLNDLYPKLIESKDQQRKVIDNTLNEIQSLFDRLSAPQKLFSKKANFYKCVMDSLKVVQKSNVDKCRIDYSAKFSNDELVFIDNWKKTTNSSPIEIQTKIAEVKAKIENINNRLLASRRNLEYLYQSYLSFQGFKSSAQACRKKRLWMTPVSILSRKTLNKSSTGNNSYPPCISDLNPENSSVMSINGRVQTLDSQMADLAVKQNEEKYVQEHTSSRLWTYFRNF